MELVASPIKVSFLEKFFAGNLNDMKHKIISFVQQQRGNVFIHFIKTVTVSSGSLKIREMLSAVPICQKY